MQISEFKSKNGYYKYFNKEGNMCRIKVSEDALTRKNSQFTIFWFDGVWNAHMPTSVKTFRDPFHVISFILKNLETNGKSFLIR